MKQWRKTHNNGISRSSRRASKRTAQRDHGYKVREKKKNKNIAKIRNKALTYEHQCEEDSKHTFHAGCLKGRLPRTSDFHHPAHDQSRKVIHAHRNGAWPAPKSVTSTAPH